MKHVLLIDDFFGREVKLPVHSDRLSLCRRLGVHEPGTPLEKSFDIELIFHRGQKPILARIGDWVENDLEAVLLTISNGVPGNRKPWDLVLLDLCFRTGRVTPLSNRDFAGMAEGRPQDDAVQSLFGLTILEGLRSRQNKVPVVIFSGMTEGEIAEHLRRFPFILGFLPRDQMDAAVKLREFLDKSAASQLESQSSLDFLLTCAQRVIIRDSDDISRLLRDWKIAEIHVLRAILEQAFKRAGTIRGEPALQPAMKLLDPEAASSTAKSADFLKRLIRQAGPHQKLLLENPLIRRAYEKASRLRQNVRPDEGE